MQHDVALQGSFTQSSINIGGGIFIDGENYFAGLGLPYMLNNHLVSPSKDYAITYNHFYLIGGYKITLDQNEDLVLFPTSQLKLVSGSPLQVSADFNCIYKDVLLGGVGYRSDNSAVLSTGVKLNSSLGGFSIIYSYDTPFTAMALAKKGSHEISLNYNQSLIFGKGSKRSRRQYINRSGEFKRH